MKRARPERLEVARPSAHHPAQIVAVHAERLPRRPRAVWRACPEPPPAVPPAPPELPEADLGVVLLVDRELAREGHLGASDLARRLTSWRWCSPATHPRHPHAQSQA